MPPIAENSPGRRVLVLIPGSVNYFYNLSGRRIAEAARELGYFADVATLASCPERPYDWCVLSNVPEILHAFGDDHAGLAKLREFGCRWGLTSAIAIDCVQTPWYERLSYLSDRAGATAILDLGLHDQGHALPDEDRGAYRFLFSGLTASERRLMAAERFDDADRVLPWAFVGHVTPHRAALVDHLVRQVDPTGFAYLPNVAPYTETGSPHLNQGQFEAVLRRTRYQVWCSHHPHFYMEPERFRTSLLTGGVPIKIRLARSTGRLARPGPVWRVACGLGSSGDEASRRRLRVHEATIPAGMGPHAFACRRDRPIPRRRGPGRGPSADHVQGRVKNDRSRTKP